VGRVRVCCSEIFQIAATMTDKNKEADTPPPLHTKMAIPTDAPAGIELDSKGNIIPLKKRTQEDQERAKKR
jgi:hypothetical protein